MAKKPKATPVSAKKLERRRRAIERIMADKARRPPIDITTAELVELARKERDFLYGSD